MRLISVAPNAALPTVAPAPQCDCARTPQPIYRRQQVAGAHHYALAIGTRLAEFELHGVIGSGGFGVVYRAYDHSLRRAVALKEYLPSAFATRNELGRVVAKSPQHRASFELGLKSFFNEAQLLAQFDHPALIKVHRFFAAHGTAYMAMPLYQADTLKQALKKRRQRLSEAYLRKLLDPLLDAIERLHSAHCLHRDISPDNILLLSDDQPLLLDLGAARRVWINQGQNRRALTVLLKPGYAPAEQYEELESLKQGPWTDLYALGAVLHYLIAGHAPPPALGRLVDDRYQPLASSAPDGYSQGFLKLVDALLSVRPQMRPQNVAQVRAGLLQAIAPQGQTPQLSHSRVDKRGTGLSTQVSRWQPLQRTRTRPSMRRMARLVVMSAAVTSLFLALTWGALKVICERQEQQLSLFNAQWKEFAQHRARQR